MIRSVRRLAVGAFLLLAVVGVALAAGRSQPVKGDAVVVGVKTSTETGVYRAPLGIADIASSTNLEDATMLSVIPAINCGGFAKVSVVGLFTSSGATCVVHCVRYRGTEFRGRTTATLTAATTTPTVGTGASLTYPSQDQEFDTRGCDSVRFLRAAPSAGDVSLKAEVY